MDPYGSVWIRLDPFGPNGCIRMHTDAYRSLTDPYGSVRILTENLWKHLRKTYEKMMLPTGHDMVVFELTELGHDPSIKRLQISYIVILWGANFNKSVQSIENLKNQPIFPIFPIFPIWGLALESSFTI